MKTLFLAWQDVRPDGGPTSGSRAWFPIGRLDSEPQNAFFRFTYTRGALKAREVAGFQPLDAFPTLDQVYESRQLFPLFQNRLISEKRADYAEYLQRLDLSESADPFEILAISGGGRQTDNLEVFPKISKLNNGTFSCRFFLHGWRHVNEASQQRLHTLKPGDSLQVALELNNPATALAIQMLTRGDYFMLGWAPRYLVVDLLNAITQEPSKLDARVVRLNPPPAPHNQRLLVELKGEFTKGYEPMSGEEFHPLN